LLIRYLDQLEASALAKGVSLEAACIAAGLPDSTAWRWRQGHSSPSQAVALRVACVLEAIDRPPPVPDLDEWHALIKRMAQIRTAQRISQEALDHRLGTAAGLVAKWECGMRRPTSFNLWCWAQSLGVTIAIVPAKMQ
jgi:transcriptional regulator with XRE-family HTH domain